MSDRVPVPEPVEGPAMHRRVPAKVGVEEKRAGYADFSNKITIFECFRKYASISYGIRPAGSPG